MSPCAPAVASAALSERTAQRRTGEGEREKELYPRGCLPVRPNAMGLSCGPAPWPSGRRGRSGCCAVYGSWRPSASEASRAGSFKPELDGSNEQRSSRGGVWKSRSRSGIQRVRCATEPTGVVPRAQYPVGVAETSGHGNHRDNWNAENDKPSHDRRRQVARPQQCDDCAWQNDEKEVAHGGPLELLGTAWRIALPSHGCAATADLPPPPKPSY